jgi:hypothetical protein
MHDSMSAVGWGRTCGEEGAGCHKKVRVFGLKNVFSKRFTVRFTTRTLIIDKNDHSAFTGMFMFTGTQLFKFSTLLTINLVRI